MSQAKQYPRALLPFYVLVIYVLVQFFWWSYLMVDQTKTIHEQQIVMSANDLGKQAKLQGELQRKWFMIAGEGSVFLALMLLGIFQVRKAFKKEGELLSRQKTFLHSVTHEFKSPVASLRLQIETLLKRNLSNEQQQTALSNALEDTDRLDQLLEKILIAARIDNGELPVYPENLNISLKLRDSIEKIKRAHPDRTIEQNIDENVYAYIDAWAFTSITTNLLENALLYSPKEKAVSVGLTHKNNHIALTIADLGAGIPAEERRKIFQKFYRLSSSSGYKGTGLGLYLVDYFIKKHKGSITVKENTQQGSIFEVVLQSKKNE
ncbi:MAG TPA: HAMP domain-containing sensor histidine kinase [Bacteroidia bacterium]|jgi:signal transduction histidine kinase|nr:HAMP domain-containing sensor histidine kinase [Bacteroidia bacterium]